MSRLKALFRKAWDLLDDDRFWLILTGIVLAVAFIDFKAGDYDQAAFDLVFAIVLGVSAWFGHANKLREARG